ncbi:MAG: nitrite reductase small subunit NirD [Verrucomicrobia bacterium]|nr:nitrite reductase small subunit NirD [Verrucomicrobiota bacterium]
MAEFIAAAEATSLPHGHGRTVHVRGRELALYNLDGQFYALDDLCPHAGGSLGGGCLQHGSVICPLHEWAFDLKTGQCLSNPTIAVNIYPTRIQNGEVQIALECMGGQNGQEQKF